MYASAPREGRPARESYVIGNWCGTQVVSLTVAAAAVAVTEPQRPLSCSAVVTSFRITQYRTKSA